MDSTCRYDGYTCIKVSAHACTPQPAIPLAMHSHAVISLPCMHFVQQCMAHILNLILTYCPGCLHSLVVGASRCAVNFYARRVYSLVQIDNVPRFQLYNL